MLRPLTPSEIRAIGYAMRRDIALALRQNNEHPDKVPVDVGAELVVLRSCERALRVLEQEPAERYVEAVDRLKEDLAVYVTRDIGYRKPPSG